MDVAFDTETDGLPIWAADHTHSRQPTLVQLAWAELEKGRITARHSHLVDPGAVVIPDDAYCAQHGFTDARLRAEGKSPLVVLSAFGLSVARADRIIAHNMDFDRLIIRTALYRLGSKAKDFPSMRGKKFICTKLASTPVLKIPGRYGTYKWPSLDEAYRKLVDPNGFEGAHDATNDVDACAKVFFALERLGAFAAAA